MRTGTQPNLGEAISLQARQKDYGPVYLDELHRIKQDENNAMAAAQKALGARKALVAKYKDELGKFTIKEESGILPVYHEPLQAKMSEIFEHFNKRRSEDDNYNPYADTKMDRMKQEFHQMADAYKISSENFTKQIANYSVNQDKYHINESLLKSVNSKDYNAFVDAISPKDKNGNHIGKTDFYSMGLLIPKQKTTSWTSGADKFADQMKNLYITASDGSKSINKKVFDEQWQQAKQDPGNTWFSDAMAVNKAMNYNDEQSEEVVKSYVLNQLPYQPAPDKGKGFSLNIGGGGQAGKFAFDVITEKEDIKSPSPMGASMVKTGEKDVDMLIFNQEGATQLPINTFVTEKNIEVVGRPLGKIKNEGTRENPNLKMQILVPKGDESMESLLSTAPPESNPDKYKKILVPITSSKQNRTKAKMEYGGTDLEDIYKQLVKSKKLPSQPAEQQKSDEKVLVEKDGKQFRLPKNQLSAAQEQGYKFVE